MILLVVANKMKKKSQYDSTTKIMCDFGSAR